MNPFLYPKKKHRRGANPGPFRDWHAYKPYLREDFRGQCVYCRIPDSLRGTDSFGIDHYRPRSRFPHLSAHYSNLFYSCNACNRRKGAFWPTRHQIGAGQYLPNPCEHEMFAHLRYRQWTVTAHSDAGAFAIELLDLNDPKSMEFRRFTLETLDQKQKERATLSRTLVLIRQALISAPAGPRAQALQEGEAETRKRLGTIERHLRVLVGDLAILD